MNKAKDDAVTGGVGLQFFLLRVNEIDQVRLALVPCRVLDTIIVMIRGWMLELVVLSVPGTVHLVGRAGIPGCGLSGLWCTISEKNEAEAQDK